MGILGRETDDERGLRWDQDDVLHLQGTLRAETLERALHELSLWVAAGHDRVVLDLSAVTCANDEVRELVERATRLGAAVRVRRPRDDVLALLERSGLPVAVEP